MKLPEDIWLYIMKMIPAAHIRVMSLNKWFHANMWLCVTKLTANAFTNLALTPNLTHLCINELSTAPKHNKFNTKPIEYFPPGLQVLKFNYDYHYAIPALTALTSLSGVVSNLTRMTTITSLSTKYCDMTIAQFQLHTLRVKRSILYHAHSNITCLDLSTDVRDDDLALLPMLVSLTMDGNTFHGSLCGLTRLTKLGLLNNASIPDELYLLTNLRHLNVEDHESIDDGSIYELTSLTYLNASEFITDVSVLTQLRTLLTYYGDVDNLPESVTELSICDNYIDLTHINTMTNLTSLNVSKLDALTDDCPEITLTSLRRLYIGGNIADITRMPLLDTLQCSEMFEQIDIIPSLTNLTSLSIDYSYGTVAISRPCGNLRYFSYNGKKYDETMVNFVNMIKY